MNNRWQIRSNEMQINTKHLIWFKCMYDSNLVETGTKLVTCMQIVLNNVFLVMFA